MRACSASRAVVTRGRREQTLRRAAEFEAVLRSGRRSAATHFVLRASPNTVGHARLGIIAGRKAAARAVDRNRVKRVVREVFRAAAPALGAYDITIQLRANVRDTPNRALRAELEKLIASLPSRGEKRAGH